MAARTIYNDSLFYFIVRTIANVIILGLTAAKVPAAIAALPFNDMIAITMGSRVYLNLKMLDKRRRRESDLLGNTSIFLFDGNLPSKQPTASVSDPSCEC